MIRKIIFYVSIVDEALSKVSSSSSNSDTSNDALNKVYRALRDGITIGDRHYEFLAFSTSRLRNHNSCFFHQLVI
ncbi:hypothetical protein C1646_697969 [Rhizophagus diaphanus]|nr:hypothetical protein C1646_697969 [Rhizophagus diaphanus] [Rhizophagus sp. MUCL 43196]